MSKFTADDVITEAKKRWAQMFSFDLDDDTWWRIVHTFHAHDLMQALRCMKTTHSEEPAQIHNSMLYHLDRLTAERRALTEWPPPDAIQIKNEKRSTQ